jgi:hypothetical protein
MNFSQAFLLPNQQQIALYGPQHRHCKTFKLPLPFTIRPQFWHTLLNLI